MFLDFHLMAIIPTIPHVLEDTRDFLSRLNQLRDIPDNTLLVTFDVVRLYPHISHEKSSEKDMLTYGKINQCRQIAYISLPKSY